MAITIGRTRRAAGGCDSSFLPKKILTQYGEFYPYYGATMESSAMRLKVRFFVVAILMFLGANVLHSQDLKLEISRPAERKTLLHWKISNSSQQALFVFDFYLWGPAYRVEQNGKDTVIETTPIKDEQGCVPNRFPPMLLLHLRPGGIIEGDFEDDAITIPKDSRVSLVVAYGTDAYSLQDRVKKIFGSKCSESPYNAILQWGHLLYSNSLLFDGSENERTR
jgi:hypothetical protein